MIEPISQKIAGGITTMAAGTILGFSALTGRVGMAFRYLAGGTMELGGMSLAAGNGFVMASSVAAPLVYIPVTGLINVAATGTTTMTFTYQMIFSEGSAGSQG